MLTTLAMAGLSLCAGCASLPPAPRTSAALDPFGGPWPASLASQTAAAVWDSLVAVEVPPERADWLAANPEIQELEDLYRQAVAFTAQRLLGPAEDLLFVLKDKTLAPPEAQADSLVLANRRSLERRIVLLAGLLAEERLILGGDAPNGDLLATYYDGLKGLSLPDSLATITQEERRAIEADLLDVQHPLVDEWMKFFTGKGRARFTTWLERKAVLDSLVTSVFEEAGLPPELIYLGVIESGLSPHARSNVGAVGYWQFMPGTARHFQLRKDWWVDERRDIERSTRSAATYLSQLYKQFENWALVLAAYNAGEGRVERAIARAGHSDFWRLSLPDQTVNHIPKFIAAYRIAQDPERYGFPAIARQSLAFDRVRVETATDLDVIARCAGIDKQVVRDLNPHLLQGISPPDARGYDVRVPAGLRARTLAGLANIPPEQRLAWIQHTVVRGETLGRIASRYGTTVDRLCEINKMRKTKTIHPGDRLLVPVGGRAGAGVAFARGTEAGRGQGERVAYRVRKGDTLSAIARRLGVSISHLCQVNDLTATALIRPGQRLYAYPRGG